MAQYYALTDYYPNLPCLCFAVFSGDRRWDVVMWMDHRAEEQAARITNTGHRVLSRVGGIMSPEMQPPKLLWLKEVRGEEVTTVPPVR